MLRQVPKMKTSRQVMMTLTPHHYIYHGYGQMGQGPPLPPPVDNPLVPPNPKHLDALAGLGSMARSRQPST